MEKRWEREKGRQERGGRRKQSLLPCGFAGLPHVNAKCSTGFNVCVCFFGILVAYIAVVPRIVYVMYVIPTASTYLFCFASKK